MKFNFLVVFFFIGIALAQGVASAANPACSQPIVTGMCMAYFEKYGYDATQKKCVKFIYGGCQGNANSFETEEECKKACMN